MSFVDASPPYTTHVNTTYASAWSGGAPVTYITTDGLVFVYSPTTRMGEIERIERKGAYSGTKLLEFVDTLARKFRLTAVRLVDAAHIESKCLGLPVPPVGDNDPPQLSLTWFRAMCTGQGWYELHGYVAEDPEEHAAYRRYVDRMRAKSLRGMMFAVLRAESSDDRWQNHVRERFVQYAAELLRESPMATFSDFVIWMWRTHCEYVAVFEDYLFSAETGRAQRDETLRSWRIKLPSHLIKRGV